jgi:hypothetical protein
MRYRCSNPNEPTYPYYGGRGIQVCERWQQFPAFFEDMGKCPPGHSIDRIDNNGNYEPGNCRWATRREQMNNTRRVYFIEWQGRRQSVSQWSRELGIAHSTVKWRWEHHRDLSTPPSSQKLHGTRDLHF